MNKSREWEICEDLEELVSEQACRSLIHVCALEDWRNIVSQLNGQNRGRSIEAITHINLRRIINEILDIALTVITHGKKFDSSQVWNRFVHFEENQINYPLHR